MVFDVLIIGGGASGMSCALLLGSARNKPYAENKKIGIINHQKSSYLQNAIFNNVYGIPPGKSGLELLKESTEHLREMYPEVTQIENEKALKITHSENSFMIETNKDKYQAKIVVFATGSSSPFCIEGMEKHLIPHQKAASEKNRIQLKNEDQLVEKGIYVCGTLAGHRSQLSIATGSGAAVAADILTLWNNNKPAQVHDAINK